MPSQHLLRLSYEFKKVLVERCLNNSVIELYEKHELLLSTKGLCYELTRLYFVVVKALLKLLVIFFVLSNILSFVCCWDYSNVTTENEKGLLYNVQVVFIRVFIIPKPWIRLKTH